MTGTPDEFTRVVLYVVKDNVSRHRGYMVHPTVGQQEEAWTVSAAMGLRFMGFKRRATAEQAMRQLSEVLDLDRWPTDDLHQVLVRWERVPDVVKKAMTDVRDRLLAEEVKP